MDKLSVLMGIGSSPQDKNRRLKQIEIRESRKNKKLTYMHRAPLVRSSEPLQPLQPLQLSQPSQPSQLSQPSQPSQLSQPSQPQLSQHLSIQECADELKEMMNASPTNLPDSKAGEICTFLRSHVRSAINRTERTKIQDEIVIAGIFGSLINMLSDYSRYKPSTKATVFRCLATIIYGNIKHMNALSSRGVIDICKSYLNPASPHPDKMVRRNALALINTIAGSPETHNFILASDGISLIVQRAQEGEDDSVAQQAVAALRNLAYHVPNHTALIKAGALKALRKAITYWDLAPDSFAAGDITMAIACLVDHENENSLLRTNNSIMKTVLKNFDNTLKDKQNYVIWKMCLAFNKLTMNDYNKQLIGDNDGINILHRALNWKPPQGAIDDKDSRILYAMKSIYNLSLNSSNKKRILNCSDLVADIKKLRWSVMAEVRRPASDCLETLGQHWKSDLEVTQGMQAPIRTLDWNIEEPEKKKYGHVMISYSWEYQSLAKKIKRALDNENIDVWMDIEKVSSNILESMSDGIEGATTIVVLASRKYKESKNCKLECEYAHQQQKKIIPVRCESGYIPDGWLGVLIGANIYIDFTELDINQQMERLIKEVKVSLKPNATRRIIHLKDDRKENRGEDDDIPLLLQQQRELHNEVKGMGKEVKEIRSTVSSLKLKMDQVIDLLKSEQKNNQMSTNNFNRDSDARKKITQLEGKLLRVEKETTNLKTQINSGTRMQNAQMFSNLSKCLTEWQSQSQSALEKALANNLKLN